MNKGGERGGGGQESDAAPRIAVKFTRVFDKREDSEARLWPFLASFYVNKPLDAARSDDNVMLMKADGRLGILGATRSFKVLRYLLVKMSCKNIAFSCTPG